MKKKQNSRENRLDFCPEVFENLVHWLRKSAADISTDIFGRTGIVVEEVMTEPAALLSGELTYFYDRKFNASLICKIPKRKHAHNSIHIGGIG